MKANYKIIVLSAFSSLSISVACGQNALNISKEGNVGIGLEDAHSLLDIKGNAPRTGNHPANLSLYATPGQASGTNIAEFRSPDATQGIGIAMNAIYAAGNNNQELKLMNRAGEIAFYTANSKRIAIGNDGNFSFYPSNGKPFTIDNNGNVSIGMPDNTPSLNKLQLGGSLHTNGHPIYFRKNVDDPAQVIKWLGTENDRLGIGGWEGVVIGATHGHADQINPTLLVNYTGKVGINNGDPKAVLDVGEVVTSEAGRLGTVFARMHEGNDVKEGTYLGIRVHSTQPTGAKSFSLEHSFYGEVNGSIKFCRGQGSTDGFLTFNTDNNKERVRITADGRVGIGTNNPQVPLQVGTYVSHYTGGRFGYLNQGGRTGQGDAQARNTSILTSGDIASGYEFVAYSDARIKKDLKLSDASKDLAILKRLQVTEYKYIDAVNYGRQSKKGFIAQQVEGVFAEAVKQGSDFVPDIFSAPEQLMAANSQVIFTMAKPHQLANGDAVKIYTRTGAHEAIVTLVSANSFSVAGLLPDYAEAFVFGKKVDDFRMVDYDRLFTLNVSATQELSRKIEKLEGENATMKNAYDALSEKISRLEAMITDSKKSATPTLTVSK